MRQVFVSGRWLNYYPLFNTARYVANGNTQLKMRAVLAEPIDLETRRPAACGLR